MKIKSELEYRGYKESNYDFVDDSGKRVSGTSKVLTFLTTGDEDEQKIKVALPKDSNVEADKLHKGFVYNVELEVILKPCIDKNNNVNEKQFFARFNFIGIEVPDVPGDEPEQKPEDKPDDKPAEQKQDKKKNDKVGGMF